MCVTPISFKSVDNYGMTCTMCVPCGKCPECLKDRQNSWKLRLMEESKNYAYLYFFTLTYNDESLPVTDDGLSTACKRDVQLWLKKFRMAFERYRGVRLSDYFKYFICAEYGPNGTHRPHYHGLFMTDLDSSSIAGLFKDWELNKGFVKWDSIAFNPDERQAVANYVSKYCCKGEFASRSADIEAGLIEKAWTIVSKGVGASYCMDKHNRHYHMPDSEVSCPSREQLDTIIDRRKVSFDTGKQKFTYKMPRYYRERLYMSKLPFEQKVWNKNKMCYEEKIVYRYSSKNFLSRQIAMRVRERVLEDFAHRVGAESTEVLSDVRFDEAARRLSSYNPLDLDYRKIRVRSKLANFYITNANKWSHL